MSKGNDVSPGETTPLSNADLKKSRTVEEKPTPSKVSRSVTKTAAETTTSANDALSVGVHGDSDKDEGTTNGANAEPETENATSASTSSAKGSCPIATTHSDTGNSTSPQASVQRAATSGAVSAATDNSIAAGTYDVREKQSSPANSDYDLTASSSECSYSSYESWATSDLFEDYF